MDSLGDFPYDIRIANRGSLVSAPETEGTLTCNYLGEHVKPDDFLYDVYMGKEIAFTGSTDHLLTAVCIDYLNDPGDADSTNLTKSAEVAQKGLEKLPDLGYRLALVYERDVRMFRYCYLISTHHLRWWEKYPLIHTGKQKDFVL